MITATYEKIGSQNFEAAIQRIARLPLPVKAAYNVKRMIDAATSARRVIREEYQAILAKYPAEGEIRTPEQETALTKETEEFGKREIVIQRDKLNWELLGDSRISAQEMFFLEPVFNDIEVIGQNTDNVLPLTGSGGA